MAKAEAETGEGACVLRGVRGPILACWQLHLNWLHESINCSRSIASSPGSPPTSLFLVSWPPFRLWETDTIAAVKYRVRGSPDLLRRTDDMSAPLAGFHPPPAVPGLLSLAAVVKSCSFHVLATLFDQHFVCVFFASSLARAGSSYTVSSLKSFCGAH